ncbi:hypothetical protein E9232_001851 [Inquilinus ginsengisoli]|uniref:Uncharacterized protein n=1 Tax=Inquilinus ginsengisoli TaxID=363840 RepID=A0ABU1JL46_9PROT|nr:hypothetical protein [Inquilinus ginsengisoli]MDR6289336.1 hypothetical protein [Inquilinus ginsengisoli]
MITSYLPPILQDRQIYEIVLARIEQPSTDQLRAAARLLDVGYLEARRTLLTCPMTVFTGRADDVLRVAASLNDVGLAHTIVPDFVWAAKDASALIAAKGLRPAGIDSPMPAMALSDPKDAGNRYALFRTDDNGVTFLIAEFGTQEEAERRAAELARGGHKQHYFIEPVSKG